MLVDRGGIPIHYEVHGDGGDPLLLLMGLGIDSLGWERQVPAFAGRHRVITVDNRGVGRSGKPPGPYTTAAMADDAAAVLDAVGVERAQVVGVSMGGMIAQELALRHPARVAALVLAVTSARPGDDARAVAEQGSAKSGLSLLGDAAGGSDMARADLGELLRFLMPLTFSERFLREEGAYLHSLFMRMVDHGFSLPGFAAQVNAVLAHDASARVPSLRAPTLVLTGSGDRLVPPHHSDELARLIPGSTLVKVEGGSHGLNFEQPEVFNRVVLDFLAAHPVDRKPSDS